MIKDLKIMGDNEMRGRRSQQLTFPVVIGFILGLIILVILIFMIVDRAGLFNDNVGRSCEKTGGICVERVDKCPSDKPQKVFLHCESKGETSACCVKSIIEG